MNIYYRDDQGAPLYQWTTDNPNNVIRNGVEIRYHGEYYFVLGEHRFHIDLRCERRNIPSNVFCRLFVLLKTGEVYVDDVLKYIPELENQVLSPQELRNACEIFVEEYADRIAYRIDKIVNDRKILTDNEWDELNITSFSGKEEYGITWKIVYDGGKEFKSDRVFFFGQCCPHCASPVVRSRFRTPKSWYAGIDEREGKIYFCPCCQKKLQTNLVDDDRVLAIN